jgi:reversibly glycosylated polypeptide / UDP-arabinopyranose mutase
MKTLLVIPSNRPESLRAFFDAWGDRGGWDQVCIIEDAPEKSGIPATWNRTPPMLHYSHKEIAQILGKDAWIISQQDSACRCFGFLVAWWHGFDRVVTLDDDCYPHGPRMAVSFCDQHNLANICHTKWVSSVPGARVRGLPYKNHGQLENIVANVGLWTGHPDLDAVQSLTLLAQHARPTYPLPQNWIVPHGQFVPVCGMNLCIERRALPLFYFPLQGKDQPYRRFDDIWAGIVAKHCMDALGWHLSVGEPFVEHRKASDPFVNLVKEAPGIGANETFWQTIAGINIDRDECDQEGALGAMATVATRLDSRHAPYLAVLGNAIDRWVKLFETRPTGI